MLDRYALTGRLAEFFARLRVDNPLEKVNLFIDGLVKDAGLLQAPADDRYAFPHLTFQEYLAACGLASRADMVNAAYGYWTGPDGGRWREVLLLFVGRLRQQGTLAVERDAVAWLERLTAEKVGREPKSLRQRAQDAVLAALSYQELGGQTALAGTQIDIEARVEGPLRTVIAAMLSTPDSGIVLDDRIAYARILAGLGDPRYPVTPDEWATSLRGLTNDTHHASRVTRHYSLLRILVLCLLWYLQHRRLGERRDECEDLPAELLDRALSGDGGAVPGVYEGWRLRRTELLDRAWVGVEAAAKTHLPMGLGRSEVHELQPGRDRRNLVRGHGLLCLVDRAAYECTVRRICDLSAD